MPLSSLFERDRLIASKRAPAYLRLRPPSVLDGRSLARVSPIARHGAAGPAWRASVESAAGGRLIFGALLRAGEAMRRAGPAASFLLSGSLGLFGKRQGFVSLVPSRMLKSDAVKEGKETPPMISVPTLLISLFVAWRRRKRAQQLLVKS